MRQGDQQGNQVRARHPGEIEAKAKTVTITGDFDAGKLVKAFNKAGFSIKVSTN